ncbi:SgcJ/EcaC family oxidoreductase [Streptomyces sp. uw30]|uniref:SgcJ/EcaC family oxidoreductase n=1 Tax=Streptomyces sp. uw30 TaxID=1828179 RepID=UPI0011CD9609|nr:SgcJ/EcaC family oxidoreductase [Streptomyces sp. uw30]TXS42127.1 SgcJ/EcaC family oxidoreductase [Streptomyces sp. uw30]
MSTATATVAPPEPTITPAPPRRSRRRTVKRVLGATALALTVAAGSAYLWLDATSDVRNLGQSDCGVVTPDITPTAAGAPTADDHRAVCDALRSMTDAWGRGDATAYGERFTPNATYTTYVGTHYQGRKDITAAHRALFDGFLKDTRLADSFLGIRFYGPDTAIVTTRGDTYTGTPKKASELSKTQTYTLVRQSGRDWRIAAFHNTKRQSVMERISFLWDPSTKPEAEK